MKYFTHLVLFLVFPLFLNAQKTQIQWGSVNESKTEAGKNFFSRQMIGSIDDNYFMYAKTRKNKHLLRFNSKNELRETTSIDFKAGETPKASSFLFAHKDENIYLIFNDAKNKEERKKLSATRNPFKSSYFMDITKINSKGEIELRETLINSKEFKFFFNVSESSSIENGKVLIFGEGNVGSDFRLGTIELD